MTRATLSRRELVAAGLVTAGALAFGSIFWREALGSPAQRGLGPYGPLEPPDANGLRLPAGFRSREIARANQPVPGTAYKWHVFPDGQAVFATQDGGWILVSNSESLAGAGGGSSAIRFRQDGSIASAYRILAGTNANCAGGPTPWGTWLSCEEFGSGQVWECDPLGGRPALNRPALGVFTHEAVAVDPDAKRLYLTEDEGDGGLYRFTPRAYPDLAAGDLEVAVVATDGRVGWAPVPDPSALSGPTRRQVAAMTRFNGGEGIWHDSGTIYFSTKGDDRVWAHDIAAARLEVVYDKAQDTTGVLDGPDNLTVSRFGELFVCEDNGGAFEIVVITPERVAAPVVAFDGSAHAGSETAGVVFDPSGSRMYFSSQRGHGNGVVYEVSGPFRQPRTPAAGAGSSPLGAGQPLGTPSPRGDVDAPGLRVAATRRVSRSRIAAKGLDVRVRVDEPGEVVIALRTSTLVTQPGARGSTPRPRTTTLAATTRRLARAGAYRFTLDLDAKARAKLRGRRDTIVRIVAQLHERDGNVVVANRHVRIVAGKRRGGRGG